MTFLDYKEEIKRIAPLDCILASKVLQAAVKDPTITSQQFHQLTLVYQEYKEG